MDLSEPFPVELAILIVAVWLICYLRQRNLPAIMESMAGWLAQLIVLSALIVMATWLILRVKN